MVDFKFGLVRFLLPPMALMVYFVCVGLVWMASTSLNGLFDLVWMDSNSLNNLFGLVWMAPNILNVCFGLVWFGCPPIA